MSCSNDAKSYNHRGKAADGFTPLFTGLATTEQATTIKDTVMDQDEFFTTFPITTLSQKSPAYSPDVGARGAVSLRNLYLVSSGLTKYGLDSDALTIVESAFTNMDSQGMHEYYSPETSEPLGSNNDSGTAASTYLAYREILMADTEPVTVLDVTAYPSKITTPYLPKAMVEVGSSGSTLNTPFYDNGSWHGFGIPSYQEGDTVVGFSGPTLVAEDYPVTISDRLVGLTMINTTDSTTITPSSVQYSAFPGQLVGVYTYTVDDGEVVIKQTLVHPTDRTSMIRTELQSSTCDTCAYNIQVGGQPWDNNSTASIDANDNSTAFNDDAELAAWTRVALVDENVTDTQVTYSFGEIRKPGLVYLNGESKLIIRTSVSAETSQVAINSVEQDVVDAYTFVISPTDLENAVYTVVGYALDSDEVELVSSSIDSMWTTLDTAFDDAVSRWATKLQIALFTIPESSSTALTQEQANTLAITAIETLEMNYRSYNASLDFGGIVKSSTTPSNNGQFIVDSYMSAAALSYINLNEAKVVLDATASRQIQSDDGIRPQDVGMIPSAVFPAKSPERGGDGLNNQESFSGIPLHSWATKYVVDAYENCTDDDCAGVSSSILEAHLPVAQASHMWWINSRDANKDGIPEWGASIDDDIVTVNNGSVELNFTVSWESDPETLYDEDQIVDAISTNCEFDATDPLIATCFGTALFHTLDALRNHLELRAFATDLASYESGLPESAQMGYIDNASFQKYANDNYQDITSEDGTRSAAVQAASDWNNVVYSINSTVGENSGNLGTERGTLVGYSVNIASADLASYFWFEKKNMIELDEQYSTLTGNVLLDSSFRQTYLEEAASSIETTMECMYNAEDGYFYGYETTIEAGDTTTAPVETTTIDVNNDNGGMAIGWIILLILLLVAFLACMGGIFMSKSKAKKKSDALDAKVGSKPLKQKRRASSSSSRKKKHRSNTASSTTSDHDHRMVEHVHTHTSSSSYEYYYFDADADVEIASPRAPQNIA